MSLPVTKSISLVPVPVSVCQIESVGAGAGFLVSVTWCLLPALENSVVQYFLTIGTQKGVLVMLFWLYFHDIQKLVLRHLVFFVKVGGIGNKVYRASKFVCSVGCVFCIHRFCFSRLLSKYYFYCFVSITTT